MTMPPDKAEQIIAEVGDPGNTLEERLTFAWELAATESLGNAYLQYLLTKRFAINIRLAEEQESANITVGQDVVDEQGQFFIHLSTMYDQTTVEITRVLIQLAATRPGVSGPLLRTRLEEPPPGAPDANDPRYSGSPYYRR